MTKELTTRGRLQVYDINSPALALICKLPIEAHLEDDILGDWTH